jgi:hypothetical protein
LQAGDAYSFYDRRGAADSRYWLEAVGLDGKSRWVGSAAVVAGEQSKDDAAAEEPIPVESVEIDHARQQIDRVDFPQPTATKRGVDSSETGFVANEASVIMQSDLARDASALKMNVRQTGWHRVGYDVLSGYGFSLQSAGNWKLFVDGAEQPIIVNADGSLEFYGRAIDTVQTDSRVYWLVSNSGAGKRISAVSQKNTQSAATGWSRIIAERKDKVLRTTTILNGDRENWFGGVVNQTELVQTLNLSEIATESNETATLGIDIQGISYNTPHRVQVVLNERVVGQIDFSDWQRVEWTVAVPLAQLMVGANTVKLRSVSASADVSLVEAVRINYPHRLKAENNRLQFAMPAKKSIKLKGFSSSSVRVFNITDPLNTTVVQPNIQLEADGTYSANISSATSPRLLMAQTNTANMLTVGSLTRNTPSEWRSTANQANFVIIAPPQFHADLQNYKNMREAQGLRTVIVDPVDIYDEFNNGIRSAEAIRSFLQYAKQNWTVRPEYALFVGDASNDPKNYSGLGGETKNLVPTMFCDTWNMEATSDTMMADFNGDNLEDVMIGRLPVRNNDDLAVLLNKIQMHDNFSDAELRQRGLLMVSDALIGYNFANGSRQIAGLVPAGVSVNYSDSGVADPALERQNLIGAMSAGPAVVNYFGHGSVGSWTGRGLFRTMDAPSLTNYSRPSLMVMIACLNGYYVEPTIESLAEGTLRNPNGGSYAVWAATGWNTAYEEELMGRAFYGKVFAGMRLGNAVRDTKALFPTVDLRRTFTFFGDPTQRLVTQP